MSDHGWRQRLVQRIGTRIDAMAERRPRGYLTLITVVALLGYACLLLFPALVLAGLAGSYHALFDEAGVAWPGLLSWLLVVVAGGLVSWRLLRLRPAAPAGVVLDREAAPDLLGLVTDTAEHYGMSGVDRVVITSGYQLDIVRTPCSALSFRSITTLAIGLPLMQCLSTPQFGCLLARRLGQFSKRTNALLNWLYGLRDIWPCYRAPAVGADPVLLPVHLLFSMYAPLYRMLSTAAARFDELQADSYAMQLYGDEEVLEAITTDTVYRLYLREKYWPVVRKLGAQGASALASNNSGMIAVLRAGLVASTVGPWVEKAMTVAQHWQDPCPILARRLDNIGHAHARLNMDMSESAVEDYLPQPAAELKAALDGSRPVAYARVPPWPAAVAGLRQRLLTVLHGLRHGHVPMPKN